MIMRAIQHTAIGELALRELPRPEPGPGQVRIRTACVGICATDLEMIAGWERTAPPNTPGHEWSGTVDATGDGVDPAWLGRRVVAENVLTDGGEVGFEHAGAYGEFFITDAANLQALPADLPAAVAALIEPLAVCVRGLSRLGLDAAAPLLVVGDGPIGLMTLILARRAGVPSVWLVGGRDRRLALASELGAARVFDHRAGDVAAQLAAAGAIPTQIVEATGSAEALATTLATAPRGSRILVLGDYGEADADFRWNLLLHRELTLVGSNASAEAWPAAVQAACDCREDLARLISHRLPATDFADGVARMRRQDPDVVKVILHWM